jgi:hypothetical protein
MASDPVDRDAILRRRARFVAAAMAGTVTLGSAQACACLEPLCDPTFECCEPPCADAGNDAAMDAGDDAAMDAASDGAPEGGLDGEPSAGGDSG